MTTRRDFLKSCLALGAAPAIVRAASLMRTVTPAGLVWSGQTRIIRFAELGPLYQREIMTGEIGRIETFSYQIGENMKLMQEMIAAKVILHGR